MRVCQFRHFGKWTTLRGNSNSCLSGRTTPYFTDASVRVKHHWPTTKLWSMPLSLTRARTRIAATKMPTQITAKAGTKHVQSSITSLTRWHREKAMVNSQKLPPEIVSQLRSLAHDLSNSIETIMQASYLLGQLHQGSESAKWISLIEDAAQDAAHINREIREVLRTHS